MGNDLGSLTCRICGQMMYFPLAEEVMKDGERLIELTCSRGHSDSYWDVEAENPRVATEMEMARAVAVGF